tara:strand:- start:318 stop:515 length:198 start_codon:yes stop_codon:yes gene_type:complete
MDSRPDIRVEEEKPMMALPFFGILLACILAWMNARLPAVWTVIATIVLTLVLFRFHATDAINIDL